MFDSFDELVVARNCCLVDPEIVRLSWRELCETFRIGAIRGYPLTLLFWMMKGNLVGCAYGERKEFWKYAKIG